MDPIYEIELEDCPFCGGPGVMQEENGWCVYVECPDCGAHTAYTAFEGDDGRMQVQRPQHSCGMWARSSAPASGTDRCGSQRRPIPCRTAAC